MKSQDHEITGKGNIHQVTFLKEGKEDKMHIEAKSPVQDAESLWCKNAEGFSRGLKERKPSKSPKRVRSRRRRRTKKEAQRQEVDEEGEGAKEKSSKKKGIRVLKYRAPTERPVSLRQVFFVKLKVKNPYIGNICDAYSQIVVQHCLSPHADFWIKKGNNAAQHCCMRHAGSVVKFLDSEVRMRTQTMLDNIWLYASHIFPI